MRTRNQQYRKRYDSTFQINELVYLLQWAMEDLHWGWGDKNKSLKDLAGAITAIRRILDKVEKYSNQKGVE